MKCKFCERLFTNKGARGKHQKTCLNNPDRVEKCGGRLKGSPSWNKGLTKEKDSRVVSGEAHPFKNKRFGAALNGHSDETKLKISDRMNRQYSEGWESTCGRSKKYDYHSIIAGSIKVDGTWELTVAKYLDMLGVEWCRNKKRFLYIKPNGISSTYQPDFYVKTWQTYLEVKGYETELDRAKWCQFEEPLIIWKKDKITEITLILAE